MTSTQSDFARDHGVSRKTVTIWKSDGRLVMVGANVDVAASNLILQQARLGKFRGIEDGGDLAVDTPVAAHPVDPDTMAEFLNGLLHSRFGSQSRAEAVKENALAGIRALELQTKAGTLMETDAAERLFFEAARSERDHWMNWPARVGPELAAELDLPADRITAALVRLVHSELADRGEPEADFATRSG